LSGLGRRKDAARDASPMQSRRPLPRPIPLLMRPLQEFLALETAGGLLLLAAAAAALFWANAPFGNSYADFWDARVTIDLRAVEIDLPLVGWVNEGLMAIFFFVAGLEIKREVMRGELAAPRKAALPVFAALGGMAAPALIFLAFNLGGSGEHGWAIPMATDIAFAVGVLSLAGSRVPLSLKVFLLALAIADDLGAIAVIAVFYTENLSLGWLAAAIAIFALTFLLGRLGVRHIIVFAGVGLVAWLAVFESGIHATIAGVAMGLLAPIDQPREGALAEKSAVESRSMFERLEHLIHPWSSFVVVPIFALANAGIAIDGGVARDAATSPVSLGVVFGLVLGKPIGIALFSFAAVKLRAATLPGDVGWPQVVAVAMVAGIGFTVSLFVTGLAFKDPALAGEAKLGILVGSALVGAAGFVVLRVVSPSVPDGSAP